MTLYHPHRIFTVDNFTVEDRIDVLKLFPEQLFRDQQNKSKVIGGDFPSQGDIG